MQVTFVIRYGTVHMSMTNSSHFNQLSFITYANFVVIGHFYWLSILGIVMLNDICIISVCWIIFFYLFYVLTNIFQTILSPDDNSTLMWDVWSLVRYDWYNIIGLTSDIIKPRPGYPLILLIICMTGYSSFKSDLREPDPHQFGEVRIVTQWDSGINPDFPHKWILKIT
jgi:hypothetical protein